MASAVVVRGAADRGEFEPSACGRHVLARSDTCAPAQPANGAIRAQMRGFCFMFDSSRAHVRQVYPASREDLVRSRLNRCRHDAECQ